jgi:hypothetical protein
MLALPDIVLDVDEEPQRFRASIMLAKCDNTARWVHHDGLGLTDIARLLVDWHDGPEEALTRWFGAEAPDVSKFVEGRRGPAKPEQVLVAAGDVDVEGLGI